MNVIRYQIALIEEDIYSKSIKVAQITFNGSYQTILIIYNKFEVNIFQSDILDFSCFSIFKEINNKVMHDFSFIP